LDNNGLHRRANDNWAAFGLAGRSIWSTSGSDDLGCRLRHLKRAAAVVAGPRLRLRLPGDQWIGFGYLHSAGDRLCRAEFAGAIGGLWRCGLFTEPRIVAQYCRLNKRLVR